LSYARILPSLWQVKTVTTKLGESLLLFNEQYDKQWIILGAKTSLHARCDGYVNCYKIILPNGSSAFYIFYIPEVLSFVGFSITMLIIIGGFLYIKKKSLVN